mgnify:CR=1 FL=1
MGNFKKKILIDLDGVLNEYGKEPFDEKFIPMIKTGAKEFLEKLSDEYEIKIFTTRNRLLTSKWIIENKLDDLVTDVTNVKDPAYLHIDDRCICFNGNYTQTLKEIENFKVYWKN